MKHIIKDAAAKAVVFCLILSFLMLTTACNKNESFVPTDNKEQSELVTEKGPLKWIGIGIGIVIVIIAVTTGQYHERTITLPDGTTFTEKGCEGFGHCHMSAYLSGPSNTPGAAISSKQEDDGYDFMGTAQLIKTSTGHILLKVENTRDNEDMHQRFFYDSILSFSQSFVIDNEQVLAQLGKSATDPIVIKGEYDVFDSQNGKFIVIE